LFKSDKDGIIADIGIDILCLLRHELAALKMGFRSHTGANCQVRKEQKQRKEDVKNVLSVIAF
jgi:hypothetical protein